MLNWSVGEHATYWIDGCGVDYDADWARGTRGANAMVHKDCVRSDCFPECGPVRVACVDAYLGLRSRGTEAGFDDGETTDQIGRGSKTPG